MKDDAVEYGALFRARYVDVLRFIERRVASPEDAAELAADVFRIAWQRFEPGAASRAWLFGIARNVVLEHYRKTGRRMAAARRYEAEFAVQLGSSQEVDGDHPVLDALARLPEHMQEVLWLRYWDGLEVAEIAQVLGVTQTNVRVRLHRARARIKPLVSSHVKEGGR